MVNDGIMGLVRSSIAGAWPSGKATDFESVYREFESLRPSLLPWLLILGHCMFTGVLGPPVHAGAGGLFHRFTLDSDSAAPTLPPWFSIVKVGIVHK